MSAPSCPAAIRAALLLSFGFAACGPSPTERLDDNRTDVVDNDGEEDVRERPPRPDVSDDSSIPDVPEADGDAHDDAMGPGDDTDEEIGEDVLDDATPDDTTAGDATAGDATDDAHEVADDVVPDVEDDTMLDATPEPDATPDVEELGPEPEDMVYQEFACSRRWAESPIRITEIMINPNNSEGQETATEWFEITNIGTTRVELNGVVVRDDGNDEFIVNAPNRLPYEGFYQDPLRTWIDPGQYLPFYQKVEDDVDCRDGSDPDCKLYIGTHFYVFRRDGGMAIANSGDEVILVDGSGRILDCFIYGRADDVEGFSWQRLPTEDGTGFTDEWCLTYESARRQYNENREGDVLGDHGTPGAPTRCW